VSASRILRLFVLLPILWLTGCLEFEDQTLTYRYDASTDTLRIFQDYHGIFGADDTAKVTDAEMEQLDSVLKVFAAVKSLPPPKTNGNVP